MQSFCCSHVRGRYGKCETVSSTFCDVPGDKPVGNWDFLWSAGIFVNINL